MFKLESYITPIILSYVEKYVKNVKAEQSQVSLWGGDAVLSNLDLRLDVLEQELHLPFTFVSGHIHELLIHVPWTRLNTEPIVITINTIECVLKLPGDGDASSENSSSVDISSGGPMGKKKVKRQESEAPPGYVQSLINKIISNVSIVCNNLILKYVEEDIVLSLNTRNLCLSSANELWEKAFTELSLPDLILRKLLQVTDMTVCLDQRNNLGKIETYQEPLLYRCSFSIHSAWCYDSLHSKTPTVSRHEIRCNKLDFSLTDTQIPMFIRIAKLVLALYYGEVAHRKRRKSSDEPANEVEQSGNAGTEEKHAGSESWSGWAWNVGSSVGLAILPIYWEDEDADPNAAVLDEKRNRVFHMGVFVDAATLVLKQTENRIEKGLFGASKQCFEPFAKLSCYGIFQEVIIKGIGIVNVRSGVSGMKLSPMGNCPCGTLDTKSSPNEEETPFLSCGFVDESKKQFLSGSLFEKDFGDEKGELKPKERRVSYQINWDDHMEELTEEKMLDRTPAFCLDYLYILDIPDDFTSEQLSEIGYDLEYSNLSERALCRFVLGPGEFKLCSGLLHRAQLLQYFSSFYDYVPYRVMAQISPDTKTKAPAPEDLDFLLSGAPSRIYQVTVFNPKLSLYHCDHPTFVPETRSLKWSTIPIRCPAFDRLPCLRLTMECLDSQVCQPMYPKRVVLAVKALEEPTQSLIQFCYTLLQCKVIGLSSSLMDESFSVNLLKSSGVHLESKHISLPQMWEPDKSRVLESMQLDFGTLDLEVSMPQILLLTSIGQSFFKKNPKPRKLYDSSLVRDVTSVKFPGIHTVLHYLKLHWDRTEKVQLISANLDTMDVSLSTYSENSNNGCIPILSRHQELPKTHHFVSNAKASPGRAHLQVHGDKTETAKPSEAFAHLILQCPRHLSDQNCTSLLIGSVTRFQVNFDPLLLKFFLYAPSFPNTMESNLKPGREGVTSSKKKEKRIAPGLSQQSTKHSSQKDQTVSGARPSGDKGSTSSSAEDLSIIIKKWYPTLNSMLMQIKIEGGEILFPEQTFLPVNGKTVSECLKKIYPTKESFELIGLAIPEVVVENVALKPAVQQFMNTVPIQIPQSVWNVHRDNLPWALNLSDFSVFNLDPLTGVKRYLFQPLLTSCTLGLTVRRNALMQENWSLCVHADVKPVSITINDHQIRVVFGITQQIFKLWQKFYSCENNSGKRSISPNVASISLSPEPSTIGPESVPRPPGMVEMYSEAGNSQLLSEVIELDKDELHPMTLWLQCTMPQFSFAAFTSGDFPVQIRCEMEDCQASFDWTPVYVKMKCRISSYGMKYLEKKHTDMWMVPADKKFLLSCKDDITRELFHVNSQSNGIDFLPHNSNMDNDSSAFNFTYTNALCTNVQKKWSESAKLPLVQGANDEDDESNENYVSEIDLKLAPVDIVLDPAVLVPFLEMWRPLLAFTLMKKPKMPAVDNDQPLVGYGINTNTLPMLYVNVKTARIFVLMDKPSTNGALNPNFCLLQVDKISLSPQADNPLSRILIRPDLYHRAGQSLTIPGSLVEDRQYQCDVSGIGLFTGCWNDVLRKSSKPEKPVLRAMGENPALEWNTNPQESRNQPIFNEVVLMPTLSMFDLQIIFAPAIVMRHRGKELSTLVAGHSLEINATKPLSAFFSQNQLALWKELSLVTLRTGNVMKELFHPLRSPSDSGIDCTHSQQSHVPLKSEDVVDKDVSKDAQKFVPFEILITGSKFTVSFFKLTEGQRIPTKKQQDMWRKYRYKQKRIDIVKEKSAIANTTEDSDLETDKGPRSATADSFQAQESERDTDYDASEEGSVDERRETIKIYPLVLAHISQPHMFIVCSGQKQKVDVSVFDAGVNLAPQDYFITCGGRRLPDIIDYPCHWFQSKQGDCDPKSGVPPSLFLLTISNFLSPPMDVSLVIDRPLKFDLADESIYCFFSALKQFQEAFNVEEILAENLKTSRKPLDCSSKKKDTSDVLAMVATFSKVSITTKQILFQVPVKPTSSTKHHMELAFGLMGSSLSGHMQSNDKKRLVKAEFFSSLKKIILKSGISGIRQTILGPVTINSKVALNWDQSSGSNFGIPNTTVNLDTTHIQLQIGPNAVKALQALKQHFFKQVDSKPNLDTPEQGWVGNMLGGGNLKKNSDIGNDSPTEQHYRDDLRAGAFQFLSEDSKQEPKPYQIIFSSNPPAMTWKYPQPRMLTRVSVFPVPLVSASELASASSTNECGLVCALQFWDICVPGFQTYAEFSLSEDSVSDLDLPMTSDIKRRAVSNLWRIVLHHVDDDSECEFEQIDRAVIVTPKSLLSVVRVDSYYSSNLIPKMQASLTIPSIYLDVYNHFDFQDGQSISGLTEFRSVQNIPTDHMFCRIKLNNFAMTNETWIRDDSSLNVRSLLRSTGQLGLDYTEYLFLSSQSLLEPTKFQSHATFTKEKGQLSIDLNWLTRGLKLRLGQFFLHSLQVSTLCWRSAFRQFDDDSEESDLDVFPLASFIICNDTPEPIRFGQYDTDENILLRSQEMHMYSWRSQKAKLMLRVCVEGGFWKWCDPVSLTSLEEGKPLVRMTTCGDSTHVLLFTCKKINSMQFQIKIRGLVSALNLLEEHLDFRIIPKVDGNSGQADGKVAEHRIVLPSRSCSPHFLLNPTKVQGVKIRLLGIGTPWSGEIPLTVDKGRRNSVLVRIPTKEKGQCTTIWCRLFEEEIQGCKRTLLFFSPLYMIKSQMPNSMQIVLSCPSSNRTKEIPLPGRDIATQLETLGSSDQKYSISFKIVKSLPASEPIGMSWMIIEQVRQPVEETSYTIDSAIEESLKLLSCDDQDKKIPSSLWPFITDDAEEPYPLSYWRESEQPNTDAKVHFSQFHPLCNTLCLNIHPWCLIVNQLGISLILKHSEQPGVSILIPNDSVMAPPVLTSIFQFGIQDSQRDYFSPPFRLSDQEWHFKQLMPSFHGAVPMEGIVQSKIVLQHQVCFFNLQTRKHGNTRIIHIKPTYLISNQTPTSLHCCALSVGNLKDQQKIRLSTLDMVDMEIQKSDSSEATSFPLLLWQCVGETAPDRIFSGLQNLSFSLPNSDWSYPLNLEEYTGTSDDRQRRVFLNFSSTENSEYMNTSLTLTIHHRRGQIHVIVFPNDKPDLILINNLDVSLLYAQSHPIEGINDGERSTFRNHHQIVKPQKRAYFTYPWQIERFPICDGMNEPPGLALALLRQKCTETEWELLDRQDMWSNAINTSLHHDEYVNIPGFGDVKVTVELVSQIVHVFVDAVSKIEFAAKDIRSRIPSPDSSMTLGAPSAADTSVDSTNESEEMEQSYVTVKDVSAASESSFLTVASPETQVSTVSRYHSLIEPEECLEKVVERPQFGFNVIFEQIAIALGDDCVENETEMSEFIRVTFDQVSVTTKPKFVFSHRLRSCGGSLPRLTEVSLFLTGMQVDNQMYQRFPHDFAVILKDQMPPPLTPNRLSLSKYSDELFEGLKRRSVLAVTLQFDSCFAEMDSLNSVHVKVAPLDINLEDKLIYKLSQVLSNLPNLTETSVVKKNHVDRLPCNIVAASRLMSNQLKLEELIIEPLDVSMSVHASVKVFVGLDRSPLNFSQFSRTRLISNSYSLGQLLARHYISGALFRAGWVVGSLDLIGSPSGFTRTIGEGVKDFVAMPINGIMTGPWSFVSGLANGSTSLVKHISAGTVTSMTNFASSVSRNMDRLSLDNEHCLRNEMIRREKPRGLGQGLLNGLSGVGVSLLGAIGGIAHHPISAVIDQGMSPTGLAMGITKAMVGAVTKPLGGAAELVAQTGQGLLQGIGWSKQLSPAQISIPEPVCNLSSSVLKYQLKMLSVSPGKRNVNILLVVEAVQGKDSCPVSLILTPEAVVVISTEEDVQEGVHSLVELDCFASLDDPTKLVLKLTSDDLDKNTTKDRVARFVIESGAHFYLSDHDGDGEEENTQNCVKSRPQLEKDDGAKEVEFYLSPVFRDLFSDLFVIAKRQLRHKGFDML